MQTEASAAASSRGVVGAHSLERAPVIIAIAFLALHAVLAATVDALDPEIFLRADRAQQRLRVLQGVLDVDSWQQLIHYLANHGIVGDYAVHAALYLVGGRHAIVYAQIGLTIFSALAVHRLAILLGLRRELAAVAITLYLSLPHTFVFPHQLVSEGLHVPLFVISNWMLAEGLHKSSPTLLGWSALWLGIATLIRPITLLWPVVAGGVIAFSRRSRFGVIYACIAFAPIVLWMMFIGAQTGRIGLGESGHSMDSNLYERVVRITATMPRAERDAARAEHLLSPDRKLGPIAYFRFAAEHPLPVLEHLLRDASVFFGKSGVERITVDYLAVVPDAQSVQSPKDGWRRQLELHGVTHTASYLWARFGAVLIVSIAGAAVMLALVLLAFGAVVDCLRSRQGDARVRALIFVLAGVVIYTFLFSQVLNAIQSRQRAPAEFALVLLATLGLQRLIGRRRGRRVLPR